MSTKATAARIYEYGEPDVFRFETMDVPDPLGHEVQVRNTVSWLLPNGVTGNWPAPVHNRTVME